MPPDTIQLLGEALHRHLGVTPAASFDALLESPPAGGTAQFLTGGPTTPLGIRAQLHHDLEPQMLVHDPGLLTLGLVETVPRASGGTLTAAIDQILDGAAYLRQLCLFEAESAGEFAYVIELVLLFTREHSREPGKAVALEETVSRLRLLARETGYLKTFGVSLLSEEREGGFTRENLRRAFPWLLANTRKWFESEKITSRAAPVHSSGAWDVTLGNYRNTSKREYKFAGADATDLRGPAVHILHGYNGSGKTTFTEALELLLTQRIERIGDPRLVPYYPIVRHRPRTLTDGASAPPPVGPTEVTLTMSGNAAAPLQASIAVSEPPAPAATAAPLATGVPGLTSRWNEQAGDMPLLQTAASFRLDQPFMDDLIRSDESKRATRFLKAFFPDERAIFDELTQANGTVELALSTLPPALQTALKDSAFADKPLPPVLDVLKTKPATWTAILPTLTQFLPLNEQQFDLLGAREPSIDSLLERWRTNPTTFTNVADELKNLDAAIEHLRPHLPEMKRHLETASRFFTEFANWQTYKRVDRGDVFEHTLNEWLELQAMADLVTKYHDVVSTLAEARQAGWHPPSAYADVFTGVSEDATRLELLKAQRDAIAQARDRARTAVHAWGNDRSPASDAQSAAAAAPPPRAHLPPSEVHSLNEVCRWLPALISESPVLLGDLVVRVLDTGEPASRGQCSIGIPNGMTKAAAEAEALLSAIRLIEPTAFRLADIHDRLAKAQAALSDLTARRTQVRDSFFSRLAAGDDQSKLLADALHELLALFKPAPWAYQEIMFRARVRSSGNGSETETLGLVSDDLPAELRLNTAEMNSFTLALFLLCAPSLPNPLRLLVLDDPLQNMDEMTVSSLARGLGRLVRIYPQGWRIVALFHAEEDLHRVRAEVPCAVYRLPWVNPTGAPEVAIEANPEEGTWRRRHQSLRRFIEPLPPA